MNQKQPIPIICGPTASGKTALAIQLAEKVSGEIVSADSRQVYLHMDIGTAKPTRQERAMIPHHLIDIVRPDENYSAGRFAQEAERSIEKILSIGKTPIIVGGSGLYLKALTQGLFVAPIIPLEMRNKIQEQIQSEGSQKMHRRLEEVDPESAKKINTQDAKKISRAIEVWETTGVPISKLQKKEALSPRFQFFTVYLDVQRPDLYARINDRVIQMVRGGLFEETEKLLSLGFNPDLNSMRAVGYKESILFLQGKKSKEETIEEIQKNTRHYAKRQVTWFKKTPIDFSFICGIDSIDKILEKWEKNSSLSDFH